MKELILKLLDNEVVQLLVKTIILIMPVGFWFVASLICSIIK